MARTIGGKPRIGCGNAGLGFIDRHGFGYRYSGDRRLLCRTIPVGDSHGMVDHRDRGVPLVLPEQLSPDFVSDQSKISFLARVFVVRAVVNLALVGLVAVFAFYGLCLRALGIVAAEGLLLWYWPPFRCGRG